MEIPPQTWAKSHELWPSLKKKRRSPTVNP